MNLQHLKEPVKTFNVHCLGDVKDPVGGGGHPRCLAVLPNNIEELIHQFKMQDSDQYSNEVHSD